MNLYLLLQIALRKNISENNARIAGALFTAIVGTTVEILQLYHIEFFGNTFDPWDFLMYALGVGLGMAIDLAIIERFEKQAQQHE